MKQKVISLDIETMANAPVGHPSASLNKFGLSYVAPITEIALYTPELDALVLNPTQDMINTTLSLQKLSVDLPIVKFLRELLSQPDLTIVGHNVVFDLRQLGGHYQFELHPTTRVFDGMTLAVRSMLVEPDKQSELSLSKMAVRFGLMDEDSPEYILYNFMKPRREDIGQIDKVLSETKPENEIWKYLGGYIPPTRPEVLKKAAQQLTNEYVALDAYYPYLMYEYINDIVDKVSKGPYKVPDTRLNFMGWSQLPDLMEEWQAYLTVASNQAIRGVDVDVPELEKRYKEYQKYVEENIDSIAYATDDNEKYPDFDSLMMVLLYYDLVLNSLKYDKSYTNVNTTWRHWKFTEINPHILGEVLEFDRREIEVLPQWSEMLEMEGRELDVDEKYLKEVVDACQSVDELEKQLTWFWVTLLKRLDYTERMSKTSLKKKFPSNIPIPTINLLEWVRLNCYDQHVDNPLYSTFLAQLKLNWMKSFVRMKEDNVAENIINKKDWKPYYMYCICDTPLPTHAQFMYHPELTTAKFKKHIKMLKDQGQSRIDYSEEVVKTGLISVNKKAMAYFIGDEEEEENPYHLKVEQLDDYRNLNNTLILRGQAEETLAHVRLDGKVHSVIINITRTGRDASTLPNMQNRNMKIWAGVFIAPAGFTLLELDYSNAENKSGAMISKDNNFAMSTESGDFHMNQAKIYWKDVWDSLTHDERGERRGEGKKVTFGVAYGMGIGRLAITLQITYDEAKEMIEERKRAYPLIAEKEEEVKRNCRKRWKAGYNPAWVSLWDGSRVQVPIYFNERKGRKDIGGNKVWNYLQQGSVGAMVHRSIVRINHYLLAKGYETYIALNVHDSIILCVKNEEYENTNVVQEVLQIMCGIVPEHLCRRTFPPVHFVSEVGPENAKKWGKRVNEEYPFPLEEFINQWGKHRLPDDILAKDKKEWEAPTWVGPIHEGWTLEKEMEAIRQEYDEAEIIKQNGGVKVLGADKNYWDTLNEALLRSADNNTQSMVNDMTKLRELSFLVGNKVQKTGLLTFPNYMLALEKLYHAGIITERFLDALAEIDNLLDKLDTDETNNWRERNGYILDLIPDDEESLSA